ncbi:MAG: hypothetical protein ACOCXT_04260 [Candidatus Dojkabacteria bacterium]
MDQQQTNQQQPMQQDPNQQQAAGGGQQQFVPYASFPATQKRDYDPNIYNMIAELVDRKYGAELNQQAREFEIARVYNKLEIEIFEMSTYQLPQDKQQELQKMTEEAQSTGQNNQDVILKIREYMQTNVPNISDMVNQYMVGFRNQYMAGRY